MERIIYPCTCRKCHKTTLNNSDSLLPEIIYGYDDMTSINFNIVCPICFTKNYIDNDSIPNSVKIELLKQYGNIIDEINEYMDAKSKNMDVSEYRKYLLSKIKEYNDIVLYNYYGFQYKVHIRDISLNEDSSKFVKVK